MKYRSLYFLVFFIIFLSNAMADPIFLVNYPGYGNGTKSITVSRYWGMGFNGNAELNCGIIPAAAATFNYYNSQKKVNDLLEKNVIHEGENTFAYYICSTPSVSEKCIVSKHKVTVSIDSQGNVNFNPDAVWVDIKFPMHLFLSAC